MRCETRVFGLVADENGRPRSRETGKFDAGYSSAGQGVPRSRESRLLDVS